MLSRRLSFGLFLTSFEIGLRSNESVDEFLYVKTRRLPNSGSVGIEVVDDTNAVSNLDILDLGADFDGLSNDFVSYAKWEWNIGAPSSTDLVNIGSANAASIYGNVDVMLLEFLEGYL